MSLDRNEKFQSLFSGSRLQVIFSPSSLCS